MIATCFPVIICIETIFNNRHWSGRSLAVGSGSMMCRVGSVVAPFCVYLADIWIYLPQVCNRNQKPACVQLCKTLELKHDTTWTYIFWSEQCCSNFCSLSDSVAHCGNSGFHHRDPDHVSSRDSRTAPHLDFERSWSSGLQAQNKESSSGCTRDEPNMKA